MDKTSRRGFIKTLGAAAASPAVAPGVTKAVQADKVARRRTSFVPASELKKLSENLYLLEDTCNVYLMRDGNRGLLIDFGSGKILDYLQPRNQSGGLDSAHPPSSRSMPGGLQGGRTLDPNRRARARTAFLCRSPELRRNRRVFHLYYVRNDFNTITENIPVANVLHDYGTFRWNNRDIFVLPTPGHTLGSVSLLAEVDGKRTAFTGDLMHSPGKLVNLWDTQINYGGAEGVDLGAFSLARLREQKPALVVPSHGAPLPDPDHGIQQTIDRLVEYYRFHTGPSPSLLSRGYAVSPHLIAHHQTTSSFYAILSKSGKAMFIDYGSASGLILGILAGHSRHGSDSFCRAQHRRSQVSLRNEVRGYCHAQPHA